MRCASPKRCYNTDMVHWFNIDLLLQVEGSPILDDETFGCQMIGA